MAKEIILDVPKRVTIQTQQEVAIDAVRVIKGVLQEDWVSVKVPVNLYAENGDCQTKLLTLWEGEAYTAIGQYTDTDIDNRIKELL